MPRTRLTQCVKALALLAILSACENPFGSDVEDGGCPRSEGGEFGTSGCFEVRGTVVGVDGLPIKRASVGPHYVSKAFGFTTEYVETDTLGQFSFRGTRFGVSGPESVTFDTLTLYVVAVDLRPFGDDDTLVTDGPMPELARDSVLTTVQVFPVGYTPSPSTVQIKLPVP